MAISLQSGIREYNGDLSQYTGMLGGLTPDVHTLRSLNPETTNRVICVMYRGPYFLMHYFGGDGANAYDHRSPFMTYKKVIEYYNMGIRPNIQDQQLGSTQLQGGFAGRTIPIPTTQNASQGQTLTIRVPELVGRPMANVHNMWVDGIADAVTGLTTYHGLVAGSIGEDNTPQRVFTNTTGSGSTEALEPSPAWEVAEFLIIALDRSGARVEGALMALGCVPSGKVGNDTLFQHENNGQSQVQQLELTYNCQFIQSAYVNDLASRYVRQFAVFGNSLNYNPGAGDAFFTDVTKSTEIDTPMFNNGVRPTLDAVQSGVGNAPVFKAKGDYVSRPGAKEHIVTPADHSRIYGNNQASGELDATPTSIANPYDIGNAAPG
jgi:hypothetical protein